MPSDFSRIQDNVQLMVDQSASPADITGYLSTEGFTPDEFKLANQNYGTFMSAVKRGGKSVGSLLADVLPAMGADLVEKIAPESFKPQIQAYKQKQMAEAQATQEEIAKKLPAEFESYKDVEGPLGALNYVKEAIGENLASFLPGLITGGVGSIAARGAITAAGELAGSQAAKEYLLSQAAKNVSTELATKRATEIALDAAKSAMAKKALQYEAGSTLAGSAALNMPDAYQAIYDPNNQDTLIPALASGAFNTVLDAITPFEVLRTMKGKGVTGEAIAGAWYKRGAHELGKGVLTEGTTEALQEMSNAKAEQIVKDNPDFFTPENLTRFIDAGLKGGLGGGAIQGATGIVFGKNVPPAAPPAAEQPAPPAIQPTLAPEGVQGEQGTLFGAQPEGRLPERVEPLFKPSEIRTTETPEGTLTETGKIQGYKEAAPLAPERELTGEQAGLQFPGQQELFTGQAPAQPEQTPPAALPKAEPKAPIAETVKNTLNEAKTNPEGYSAVLRGNNPTTAKIVTDRIESLLPSADADPVEAMEKLYSDEVNAKTPRGTKPLSPAQLELLKTVYRRVTGRDIEDTIKERAFMGAQQAELFPEGDQNVSGETQPTAGTTGADVGVSGGVPTGTAAGPEGVGVGGVGVDGSGAGAGRPAGGEGAQPVTLSPEEAWNKHWDENNPAYNDLSTEEKAAWNKLVAAGKGDAVNFEDIVRDHIARVGSKKQTPEKIKEVTEKHQAEMSEDIEDQIKNLNFEEALLFLKNNGPAANQAIVDAMYRRYKELKSKGFKFTFRFAATPQDVRDIGGYTDQRGNINPHIGGRVQTLRGTKLMDLSIAGRNSGQNDGVNPFKADYEVATHEFLHAVTAALVSYGENNPKTEAGRIASELKALSNHVRRHLEAKAKAGTLTPAEKKVLYNSNALGNRSSSGGRYNQEHEMISWGFTSGETQQVLESIPYKKKTAFSAFVETVRKLIGLAPKNDTALSAAIRLGQEALESSIGPISQIKTKGVRLSQETGAKPSGLKVPELGQPYNLPKATKLEKPQTSGEKTVATAQKIYNAWNDDSFWTKFRIAAIDPTSGLTKTLSSLPIFQNGQLRADMLIRSFSQVINLIKNGLQSGVPVLNADGSVVIMRSDNNMARSQILADQLDNNPIVSGSGFSGRAYIAEIARIKRGEEVMQEDAAVREEAKKKMQSAKDKMARAKQLRAAGAPITEIIKLINQAKAIRAEWGDAVNLNREKQITDAHIEWANKQLQAVPEAQKVLDIWRNINMALIDLNEQVGNFSKEKADRYRSKKYYVPLYASRVDMGPEKQEGYTGRRTSTKSVAKEYHLEGSDLERNIWENMDKYYAAATAASFQNQTRKVAVQQLMSDGIDSARYADFDDERVNLRYKDPTNPYANKDGIVSVILDNPNDLAAFQVLHYELNPLMKGLSATTQALRAGALINPMYWIKQLIRDPIHAALVSNSGIVTPFHAAKEYLNILANNSEEAKLLASRGVIGQIDSTIDLHSFLNQVGTERMDPSRMQKMFHKVMQMHEASDAATRVAIYKKEYDAAIKRGMSKEDATNLAVHKARESINFAVRGNSKTLNVLRHMIPFFSASLTSLDTVYRAATGYGLNPEEKKAAQTLFAKRAAIMTMLSVAYAMMLQDDEDYKKLPDNVKDNNWLLPSPIGDEHSFIKVAVPFEVGFLFKTLPEASVRYLAGNSTGKEMLASIRHGVQQNLPGEGIPLPQAIRPALEAVTNYSFYTGRSIEGMSDQGLPVAARGPNASEFSKTLSSLGLDQIGLSPAKLDHLIQGYTAELGAFSANMASGAISMATGKESPDKNLEQQPFFKSFLTNPNTSKAATDYYDLAHNAQEAVNYVNRLKKEGRVEEAKEYLSDEEHKKLVNAAPAFRRVGDQMAKIRAQINRVKEDVNRTSENKREEINRLQTIYDRVARQGYKIAESAGIER